MVSNWVNRNPPESIRFQGGNPSTLATGIDKSLTLRLMQRSRWCGPEMILGFNDTSMQSTHANALGVQVLHVWKNSVDISG